MNIKNEDVILIILIMFVFNCALKDVVDYDHRIDVIGDFGIGIGKGHK